MQIRIRNKFVFLMAVALSIVFHAMSVALAASNLKSDHYREILASNNFILVYDNVTPVRNVIKDNEIEVFDEESYRDYMEKMRAGMLVKGEAGKITYAVAGNSKYKEMHYGHMSECKLEKNGLVYNFCRLDGREQPEYYGVVKGLREGFFLKKERIMAQVSREPNYKGILFRTGPVMDKLLGPILPKAAKNHIMPDYQLMAVGTAENGDSYEDYLFIDNQIQNQHYELMRYCFNGDEFYKILAASFDKQPDGSIHKYRKHIMLIYKFSDEVEDNLFMVPQELRIITE